MALKTYLLDVRFARPAALDGVGRFLWHAAAAVPAALAANERLVLLCLDDDRDAWRAAVPTARIESTDVPIASLVQHAASAWPRLVEKLVDEVGVDVVHYPQYDMPLIPRGLPSVATIYDFTPFDEERYFGAGRTWRRVAAAALYASMCARATLVTTLSHAIARVIEERTPALAGRVRVTAPGPSQLAARPVEGARDDNLFVYVGNHRPHKRVDLLVRAFSSVRRQLPGARLVLFGRRDARFPLPPFGPADGVELVEGAPDDVIAATLAQARALVFPSVGEGYGFPVAEAQSLGTPSIVADAGSLPEVADGAGLVVPRDDDDALARAIVRMARDDALFAETSARAARVHAARSWAATATALLGAWRDARARSL